MDMVRQQKHHGISSQEHPTNTSSIVISVFAIVILSAIGAMFKVRLPGPRHTYQGHSS